MKSSLVESCSYLSPTDHTRHKIALNVVQHKTTNFHKNVLREIFNHIVTSVSSIGAHIILQCQRAEWTNLADLLMKGLNMEGWPSSLVSALFLMTFYYRFTDFNHWHREIHISTGSMRETLLVQLHMKRLLFILFLFFFSASFLFILWEFHKFTQHILIITPHTSLSTPPGTRTLPCQILPDTPTSPSQLLGTCFEPTESS